MNLLRAPYVSLLENFNIINNVHSIEKQMFVNVVNFVEKWMSILDIFSDVTCEVMVPKVKHMLLSLIVSFRDLV